MPDFWRSSGFHLLERDPRGRLVVTNAFLRAYLMRPEMRPVAESCAAERTLHAALSDDPRRVVAEAETAAFADPDAAENYRLWLGFRDRLLAAATLEDAYLGLFAAPPRADAPPVPPLFIDQLVQIILRGMLDRCADPFRLRAAELFFRPQKATVQGGAVMLADEETIEMLAAQGSRGALGGLLGHAHAPPREVELEVLSAAAAEAYWSRDERHDLVLDLTFARPGLDALTRLLETWVSHFLDLSVSIEPVRSIRDERWVWHVGLDAESSLLMNELYQGTEVAEDRLARVLGLFRLSFTDPRVMRPAVAGRPVYLGLAMDAAGHLRLKPQNLLVNLPLASCA